MNCTRVEKLLPLYIEGDLEDERTSRALAAHLETCRACHASADAWLESQKLLRLHEPPEFDAAFFADVRRAVLQRIDEKPARAPFAYIFAPLLTRRGLAFAASAALLLLAATLLLQLRRAASHMPGEEAVRTGPAPRVQTSPVQVARDERVASDEQTPSSGGTTPHAPQRPALSAQTPAPSYERARRASLPAPVPDVRTPRTSDAMRAAVSRENPERLAPQMALPEHSSRDGSAAVNVAAAKNSVTRIEFQTSDPNIRIIWLSPQTVDASFSKPSNDNR